MAWLDFSLFLFSSMHRGFSTGSMASQASAALRQTSRPFSPGLSKTVLKLCRAGGWLIPGMFCGAYSRSGGIPGVPTPLRAAYGALLRDHNRQLVATLTSMNSAPSAGATPNQSRAYVLPLPGVIATEQAQPLLQQGLQDVCRLHGPASESCVPERQLRHLPKP